MRLLCALARAGVPTQALGPIVDDGIAAEFGESGVVHLPPVRPQEIPELIDQTSALILPYSSERGETLVPAKLWNCVATNRTVLARGLKLPTEVEDRFSSLDAEDGLAIEQVLDVVRDAPSREPRVETWANRWATVEQAVAS